MGTTIQLNLWIQEKRWLIVAQKGEIQPHGMGHVITNLVRLHPISMMILAEE